MVENCVVSKTAVTKRKVVKSVTFKLVNTRIIQGLSVENVRQMP